MSCELRLLASLSNIQSWRKYLFAGENDDINWLHKCVVAVSPTGDKILVAHGGAMVLLHLQYGKGNDEKPIPHLVVDHQWDSVDELKLQDNITSAAFLPLAHLDNHSHGCPDWTCVALGFSSGNIRFFTENMDLLVADHLQPEPLLHIRVNSQKEKSKDSSESTDEIYAVFPSVICLISGSSLQNLRNRRKEIALTRARSLQTVSEVTLDVKKYEFPVQPVRDAAFVGGSGTDNLFDHLLDVSLSNGFSGTYRPSPPHHSTVASTGADTWLQFQNTMDGIVAPVELTDVAIKVMSILPSWLGMGSSEQKTTVIRPLEKLAPKCRLLDRRREGRAIFPSPDGTLLAVADSLGRVTLVDVRTRSAIRMWKGYRDAECGFLEVKEELSKHRHRHRHQNATSNSESPRRVLLLAIYAPKKGLVELFPLRHGRRVAALRVGKNGRLVYTPHGLLGHGGNFKKSNGPALISLTFLSGDGLMDISVPFHCALLDASARSKDVHQLKQLKLLLKDSDRAEEETLVEMKNICKKIETDDIRLQAVEYLSALKIITPNVLCCALDIFLEHASDDNGQRRSLLVLCKQLRAAVNFFIFLQTMKKTSDENAEQNQPLTESLFLSESEVKIFVEFVKNMQLINGPKREVKVKFSSSASGQNLHQLLQSLDVSEQGTIIAKPNIPDDDYRAIGELIFSRVSASELEDWKNAAKMSNIGCDFFSRCLLHYWLNKPISDIEKDVQMFLVLLKTVVSLSDEPVASPDSNTESLWWTEFRSIISNSPKVLTALVISVCCRAVSIQCEQEMELSRAEKCQVGNDWETVSADTWQWDSLITNLEDVALLNTVMSYRPETICKFFNENNEVSLTELKSAGEEAVSEKVAKWLVQFFITPCLLLDKSDVEFQKCSTDVFQENETKLKRKALFKGEEDLVLPLVEVAEEANPGTETESLIIKHLNLLKRRFPYSLTSSVILSHLAWETLAKWRLNITCINYLELAVEYIKIIPSTHLRAAICVLAWATYLKIHFEGAIRLISKVGKLPTDTLCMRELDIPKEEIPTFLESSLKLLTALLDACAERPQVKFIRRRETLWHSGGNGLIAVASTRPSPCEDMVLIHYHINSFFLMVAALELKEKNLFTALIDSMKPDLFGDLTQKPTWAGPCSTLIKNITRFLCRVVSASVQTIHEVETSNGTTDLDTGKCSFWLRQCFSFANFWQIPTDSLRIQQVCELYSCGFDRLAEEAFQDVTTPEKLYSQLLVIVGQRINSMIASSAAPEMVISNLNPSLTSWLQTLDENVKEAKVNLDDTELLVNRLQHMVPDNSEADKQLTQLIAKNLPGLRN